MSFFFLIYEILDSKTTFAKFYAECLVLAKLVHTIKYSMAKLRKCRPYLVADQENECDIFPGKDEIFSINLGHLCYCRK